eukprot:TRINITY_DN57790_c1_g1_i1.p1 TRINITY_DN57790_c1_g1~~TRINITY_DN57790_c1_g1_i1.p1  ORF type:complete len:780 (+),score=84.01 TRINITY_DN57790_c1_g1_i1:74-2413(+)
MTTPSYGESRMSSITLATHNDENHPSPQRTLSSRRGTNPRRLDLTVNNKERLKHKAVQDINDTFTNMRQLLKTIKERKVWNIGNDDLAMWTREMQEYIETVEERVESLVTNNILPTNTATAETPSITRRHTSFHHSTATPATPHNNNRNGHHHATTAASRSMSSHSLFGASVKASSGGGHSNNNGSGHNNNNAKDNNSSSSSNSHKMQPCSTAFQQVVTGSVYLLLEGLCAHVGAERGTLFQYAPRTDELQAVAVVGSSDLKPNMLKVPANCGFCGAVFTSGIGINVSNVYAEDTFFADADKKTGFRTRAMLAFPIIQKASTNTIGVLQVLNKNRGTCNFNSDDEAFVCSVCPIVSYLLTHYPLDPTATYFDPSLLHQVKPFVPAAPADSCLPTNIDRFNRTQLIHRSTQPLLATLQLSPLHGSSAVTNTSLREVSQHISNLEQSWRMTISANMQLQNDADMKAEKMRNMRDLIRTAHIKIKQLKDKLSKWEDQDEQDKQLQQAKTNERLLLSMAETIQNRNLQLPSVVGNRSNSALLSSTSDNDHHHHYRGHRQQQHENDDDDENNEDNDNLTNTLPPPPYYTSDTANNNKSATHESMMVSSHNNSKWHMPHPPPQPVAAPPTAGSTGPSVGGGSFKRHHPHKPTTAPPPTSPSVHSSASSLKRQPSSTRSKRLHKADSGSTAGGGSGHSLLKHLPEATTSDSSSVKKSEKDTNLPLMSSHTNNTKRQISTAAMQNTLGYLVSPRNDAGSMLKILTASSVPESPLATPLALTTAHYTW